MQPILTTPSDESQETIQSNGIVKQEQPDNVNGKQSIKSQNMNGKNHNLEQNVEDEEKEKIVLPVEMASMVSLKTLIGKLIHKAHADLMTLTDTLPSMSDVEKKRQILTYSTFIRKQFLKLLVLVKWAKNAKDIQMCQNIMAFLANQNKIFQDTVDYLHKIHLELPAARLRNFDIPTAVDVLTTGSYQRMPTKIKDMMAPTPLTDEEVLATFRNMNDVIRMRIVTTEVLPPPMRNYRIENGRIYFLIENEFEVVLTLMGNSNNRRWWVVSLDIFVQASSKSRSTEDIDITLNDIQKQHLRVNAQKQLVPPVVAEDQLQANNNNSDMNTASSSTPSNSSKSLFFPLVNMYDYLHLSCLHMQLEILYIQAVMLSKTRWINQLKVQMNQDRTKLTLVYWRGGSAASHWGKPQTTASNAIKSTMIEISINNEDYTNQLRQASNNNTEVLNMKIHDELKGLTQKTGIGASIALSDITVHDRPKVLSLLKYPKNSLQILWNDRPELYTDIKLIESSNLDIEQLVLHVTNYHGKCIIDKFKEALISEKNFLEENGLYLTEGSHEDVKNESHSVLNSKDTKNTAQSLIVRYRHQRYISIEADSRTGRIKAFDTSEGCNEGDFNLRGLEDRLNNDPKNISQHLLWIRSEVVIREVVSLAKQLNLQPYHPSQMNLRSEDLTKLFGDIIGEATANTLNTLASSGDITTSNNNNNIIKYPSHCVFLQFPQFEDWHFVIAIVKNEFKSWLCCINKTYDQSGLYHAIVDLTYFDCNRLWKDQFIEKNHSLKALDDVQIANRNKRHLEDKFEETTTIKEEQDMIPDIKRRRKVSINNTIDDTLTILSQYSNKVDNLSIDLRFLAKLDSLCKAYITNRKIELQLQSFRGSISYHLRPLLQTLSNTETQVINHPAADKIEVICIPQRDLLKTCAYHFADDGTRREKPLETIPWIEQLATRMKNDVLIRSSGWWDRGRDDCYVVIQEKFEWRNLILEDNELGDHISLDKSTNVLSFTYPNIDTCVMQFLLDWERVFMMTNLTRQVSSVWLKKYKEHLKFNPTNLQELSFTYAKNFTCSIKWASNGKERSRQYNIELDMADEGNKTKTTPLPILKSRNPHWRIISFLRDVLNEKRDLIYFVQILFQTLPLMTCLEHLEAKCAIEGDIGKILIIPRAYDSVRVIFSAKYAIDIRFTDKTTICVSDAAYHHLFYSTCTKTTDNTADTFIAPQPYLVQQQTINTENNLKPIKVAQQFKFMPFDQFSGLLDSLDTWLFSMEESTKQMEATDELFLNQKTEPSALSLQHGLLCSASLCQGILYKLQAMV